MTGGVRGTTLALGLAALAAAEAYAADAPRTGSAATAYTITIDPTPLAPPTWWQVPGVTPLVSSLDPGSSDAFRTTASHDLTLKPGTYRFGTFTFDFQFVVTPDGLLDFAPSLDQCVEGRGTRTLKVRCTQTQPYGGQREY
jgi:hypothetical protein